MLQIHSLSRGIFARSDRDRLCGPCQINGGNFAKRFNVFPPLAIYAKSSIIGALQDPKYTSAGEYTSARRRKLG